MRYTIPKSALAFPKPRRVKRRGRWPAKTDPAHPLDTEAVLQEMCEEYLDACGLRWVHIPAAALYACSWGSRLTIHAKREISDYLKGVPDLMVFAPRGDATFTRALLVELKVGRNKLTDGQRRFADSTTVNEVRDFDTFKALVDKFIREAA